MSSLNAVSGVTGGSKEHLLKDSRQLRQEGNQWLNVGFSSIVSNLISLILQEDAGTFLTQFHFPFGHFFFPASLTTFSNVLDPKGLLHLDTVSSDLLVHLSIRGT